MYGCGVKPEKYHLQSNAGHLVHHTLVNQQAVQC